MTAVELAGITKRFPGVVANHDIHLSVRKGTVHALVGENGAGKSTLMKILYGMQKPDEGTIAIDGEQVSFSSPADAIARGIGMVHQHFMLADNLTVLENVVLGSEKLYGIGGKARRKIKEISERYGLGVRPDVLVEELGVAARQRVEILKVLYRGARTLILDEPTAVLVPQEVDALFANLRELKSEGLSVIFISHKLGEVLSVADEITVIRRGTTVGTAVPAETTSRQLAEMMVGSELPTPETAESTVTDRPVLTVKDLRLEAAGGKALLDDITFTIHAGEVLGLAGVEGNGQTELVDALIGLKPADSGTITLAEEEITTWATRKRREQGIGYIPEDRHRHGLLLEAPLWENRILGHVTEKPNAKGFWLDPKAAQEDTRRIVKAYDVRTPGIDVTAASLSGGNQQKLIVGREMSHQPRFLIAAHPTRGVDVGAQAQIWDQIREARREGLAVLLISADLDELIGLSDTLRVIYNGKLVADADPATITPEELGSAMTGAATGHLEHEEPPADGPAETSVGVAAEGEPDGPAESTAGAPAETSADGRAVTPAGPAEGQSNGPAESPAGGSAESPAETSAASPAEPRAGGAAESQADGSAESPAATSADGPAEPRADGPAEPPAETSADDPADLPAEGPARIPSQGQAKTQADAPEDDEAR